MAHFAQLDENNFVLQVLVVKNSVLNNLEFPESEQLGVDFCKSLYGQDTVWKQTSYNGNFRVRFAEVGGKYCPPDYDGSFKDGFTFVKPDVYPSFVVNENGVWVPPIPPPDTINVYKWDEATLSWIEVPKPHPSWVIAGSPPHWWEPPIPYPNDGKIYRWDEETQSWVEVLAPQVEE